MKIIETKIYTFDELSNEAKENAIEQIRNSYYNRNDFWEWSKDDCALLEPPHKEMIELFGDDYKFPLIKNLRNGLRVYEGTADLSKGAKITNIEHFLKWLGLDDKCNYSIVDANILLWLAEDKEPTEEEELLFEKAQTKFRNHLNSIFDRVQEGYDYRFTDEAIIEDIEENDCDFLEDGTIF